MTTAVPNGPPVVLPQQDKTGRDKTGRINPGAARAQAAAAKARQTAISAGANPATVKPLSPSATARRATRDRQYNEDYARVNGTLSVDKRYAVVMPALENLGYTKDQAHRIAIDAPLPSGVSNEDALRRALWFAYSVTPDEVGRQTGVAGSLVGTHSAYTKGIPMPEEAKRAAVSPINPQPDDPNAPIPMPQDAKRALRQVNPRYRTQWQRERLRASLSRLGDTLSPFANWMSNRPVPGGLGGLFLLNLGFLFLVTPANPQGWTRANLLYGLLFGRTEWNPRIQAIMPHKQKIEDSALMVDAAAIAAGVSNMGAAAGALANGIGGVVGQVTQTGTPANQAAQVVAVVGKEIGGVVMPGVFGPPGTGSGPVGGTLGAQAGGGPPKLNVGFGPRPQPTFTGGGS